MDPDSGQKKCLTISKQARNNQGGSQDVPVHP